MFPARRPAHELMWGMDMSGGRKRRKRSVFHVGIMAGLTGLYSMFVRAGILLAGELV